MLVGVAYARVVTVEPHARRLDVFQQHVAEQEEKGDRHECCECAGDPKDVLEARYTTHLMLTTITLLCLHEPQNVLKCIILRTKLY